MIWCAFQNQKLMSPILSRFLFIVAMISLENKIILESLGVSWGISVYFDKNLGNYVSKTDTESDYVSWLLNCYRNNVINVNSS